MPPANDFAIDDLLDAARSASAVGAFGLATEILDRGQLRLPLCVLCFARTVLGAKIVFGGITMRVCQLCLDTCVGPQYERGQALWVKHVGRTFYPEDVGFCARGR